jgi:GNAT superfamily N-acetyltransferase
VTEQIGGKALVVEPAPVSGDEERRLLRDLETELVRRYRGTPGEGYADVDPTHPEHFTPPDGTFLVARSNGRAVGCGGIRRVDERTAEIKRMYVVPDHRGNGIARAVLAELERWAGAAGYERIILESGTAQPDACALYESSGYERIEPYGVWKDSPESICYDKYLRVT